MQSNLDNMTEEVLRTKPHQSTATSILDRQRALTSNHQYFQLELITVESDGQLNQSSEKFRECAILTSCQRNW